MATLSRWKHCKKCGLHKTRRQVVLGKGPRPCDIMMIGEGPGESEDMLGKPFVGRSGKLLDKILAKAAELADVEQPPVYITNTVACRPPENRNPDKSEVAACRDRLLWEVKMVKPSRIVLIGKVAQKLLRKQFPDAVHIVHPAYVLRTGGEKSSYFASCARELANLMEEHHGVHNQ